MTTATEEVTYTEADLTAMLRRKLTRNGNGGSGEYAFMAQVRNRAGFDANRTFDAVAVSLWPSRGFVIHVYEIKVSRSDWLAELRKPDKAEDAAQFGEKFSIVVPPGIIQKGELPPTWGQLTVRGDGLVTTKEAPYLHDLEGGVKKLPPIPRTAAGVSIGFRADDAARVGAALKTVLAGDQQEERARRQMTRARDELRQAADHLDQYLNTEGAA